MFHPARFSTKEDKEKAEMRKQRTEAEQRKNREELAQRSFEKRQTDFATALNNQSGGLSPCGGTLSGFTGSPEHSSSSTAEVKKKKKSVTKGKATVVIPPAAESSHDNNNNNPQQYHVATTPTTISPLQSEHGEQQPATTPFIHRHPSASSAIINPPGGLQAKPMSENSTGQAGWQPTSGQPTSGHGRQNSYGGASSRQSGGVGGGGGLSSVSATPPPPTDGGNDGSRGVGVEVEVATPSPSPTTLGASLGGTGGGGEGLNSHTLPIVRRIKLSSDLMMDGSKASQGTPYVDPPGPFVNVVRLPLNRGGGGGGGDSCTVRGGPPSSSRSPRGGGQHHRASAEESNGEGEREQQRDLSIVSNKDNTHRGGGSNGRGVPVPPFTQFASKPCTTQERVSKAVAENAPLVRSEQWLANNRGGSGFRDARVDKVPQMSPMRYIPAPPAQELAATARTMREERSSALHLLSGSQEQKPVAPMSARGVTGGFAEDRGRRFVARTTEERQIEKERKKLQRKQKAEDEKERQQMFCGSKHPTGQRHCGDDDGLLHGELLYPQEQLAADQHQPTSLRMRMSERYAERKNTIRSSSSSSSSNSSGIDDIDIPPMTMEEVMTRGLRKTDSSNDEVRQQQQQQQQQQNRGGGRTTKKKKVSQTPPPEFCHMSKGAGSHLPDIAGAFFSKPIPTTVAGEPFIRGGGGQWSSSRRPMMKHKDHTAVSNRSGGKGLGGCNDGLIGVPCYQAL